MPTQGEPLIAATDVCVSSGTSKLIDNVSLSIGDSEIVTIIGPNGAGKTTLLRTLLGLTPLSSGSVKRRDNLRIGYMPQTLDINPALPLTVKRFLQLGANSINDFTAICQRLGVTSLFATTLRDVSGGEMQRVLLARALLAKPNLLVLDEPAQGVDVSGQAELYRLISEVRDEYQCGVLMVSHDLHLVMAATDSVICLNRHVCCHGHPEQVSNDPAFLELFDAVEREALAIYAHHHDHAHDLHGDIKPAEPRDV